MGQLKLIIFAKKWSLNFCSNCSHEPKLGANEVNHEKVVPVKDKENKRTFNSLIEPAYPNWARYWLICSKVLLLLSPLNLIKWGNLKPAGYWTESKELGYGFLRSTSFTSNINSKILFNQFSQIILILSKYLIKITWRIWLCRCRCSVLVLRHIVGGTGLTGYRGRSDRLGCTGLTGLMNRSDRSLPVLPSLHISIKHLICYRINRCHDTSGGVQVVDYMYNYNMEVQHWQVHLFGECWLN